MAERQLLFVPLCQTAANLLTSQYNAGMCSTLEFPDGASWFSLLINLRVFMPSLLYHNRWRGVQVWHLNTKINNWDHLVLHWWSYPWLLYGTLVGQISWRSPVLGAIWHDLKVSPWMWVLVEFGLYTIEANLEENQPIVMEKSCPMMTSCYIWRWYKGYENINSKWTKWGYLPGFWL